MSSFPLNADADADDEPTAAKPKRSHQRKTTAAPRRRERQPRASLDTRIRESLEAVADWLIERGDAELGLVLREDARKMSAVLQRVAGTNPVAKKVVGVIADALEPVRAFGPTLRVLWRRLLERRAVALAEREAEEVAPEELLTQTHVRVPVDVDEEPRVAEPWKLR